MGTRNEFPTAQTQGEAKMKSKLMISTMLIACGVAVSGCETLTETFAFDAIPRATFKDKPTVIDASKKTVTKAGKKDEIIIKVTDRIILVYASDVQKFMRLRMSGKRVLRKVSAGIQVMTAAIAAALTAFGGSPVTIASFAGVSAIIPEFQGIFQAKGGAEAFRHGAELIGDAETDYLLEISKTNHGNVPGELTPQGAVLYKRVVASIVLVEKALLQQIPSLKEVQKAEEKFEGKFGADESSGKINTWLGWDGTVYGNARNFATLEAWIKDKKLGNISVPYFVNEAGFHSLRAEFIAERVNS